MLRQLTDELMYEIRDLSRQEYVDEYATRKHDAMPAQPTAVVLGADGNGSRAADERLSPRASRIRADRVAGTGSGGVGAGR